MTLSAEMLENSGSKAKGDAQHRARLKELTRALKATPTRALPRPVNAPQGLSHLSPRALLAGSGEIAPSLCLSPACHSHSGSFRLAAITHSVLPFYLLPYSMVTRLSHKKRHVDGQSSFLAVLLFPLGCSPFLAVTWF